MSKWRRTMAVGAVAVVAAGVGVVGTTATSVSAAAAPYGFYDGSLQESTIVNCISMGVISTPYTEAGVGVYVGAYQDPDKVDPTMNYSSHPAPYPAVGDTFYIHVVMYGIGNDCVGQYGVPNFSLPAGLVPAWPNVPIRCYGIGKTGALTEAGGADCPQSTQSGAVYGAQYSYAANNPTKANLWPIPTGMGWDLRFPVKANAVVSGGTLDGRLKIIDGWDNPILHPTSTVYAFASTSGGPTPPPAFTYDAPATTAAAFLTPDFGFPAGTRTGYGVISRANLLSFGATGQGYFEIRPHGSTGAWQPSPPLPVTNAGTSWAFAEDWDETTITPPIVGQAYDWRLAFTPTVGSTSYGATQTFTLPARTCNGLDVTVALGLGQVPTAGDDVIMGDASSETISGGGGNDTICGGGGNDTFVGGPGADTIIGGAGVDTISFADDPTGAGVSVNLASGNGGGDTFSNIENVIGTPHNDTLVGNSGDNRFDAGLGDDSITGGGGNDTVTYGGTAGVTVNLANSGPQNTVGAGVDTLSGIANVVGSNGDDTLTGDSGNNMLDGGAGNDTINGGGGDDRLVGGAGDDSITGGGGNDTVTYGGTAGVTVNLANPAPQNTIGAGIDTLSGIANVVGSNGDDNLIGDSGNNMLDGGPGNDTIRGLAGNDVLVGGAGVNTVSYAGTAGPVAVNLGNAAAQNTLGAGVDTLSGFANLIGGNGNDNLIGTSGANRIDGGPGNDTIRGLAGNDVLVGGAGVNTVSYAGTTGAVTVNLGSAAAQNTVGAGVDTLSGFVNLIGGNGADKLLGTAGANRIDGGPGNDTIRGLAGNDVLIGGTGINTVSYAGNVKAVKVSLAVAVAQNTLGAGVDTLSGFSNVTGGNAADTLTGNAGKNTLNGGPGTDHCNGGAGVDIGISCEVKTGIP